MTTKLKPGFLFYEQILLREDILRLCEFTFVFLLGGKNKQKRYRDHSQAGNKCVQCESVEKGIKMTANCELCGQTLTLSIFVMAILLSIGYVNCTGHWHLYYRYPVLKPVRVR